MGTQVVHVAVEGSMSGSGREAMKSMRVNLKLEIKNKYGTYGHWN